MKRYRFLLLLSVLMCAGLVHAQSSLPTHYSCDFEDEVQRTEWKFLSTTEVGHSWHVGTADKNSGEYGLYVSNDGGTTSSYNPKNGVVFAYTEVTLAPVKLSDRYVLSFDWIGGGNIENGLDGLYAFWVPDSIVVDEITGEKEAINLTPSNLEQIDDKLMAYALTLNMSALKDTVRYHQRGVGKSTWQAYVSPVKNGVNARLECAPGKKYRLVFAWMSSNGTRMYNPAPCVDNINIISPTSCGVVDKLVPTAIGEDTIMLSWDGSASLYEVGCYSYETNEWIVDRVDSASYAFVSVPEGMCTFYVRSVCEEDGVEFYSGKVVYSELIYYPGRHCIDYITMSDLNCYVNAPYSTEGGTWPKPQYVTGDYGYIHAMIDDGSMASTSRHTHHFDKNEYDAHTGFKLKTVPEGELASVRLGNWLGGGQSERVEFNYTVDAEVNPILVLKYAVVLESPGHDKDKKPTSRDLQDPRFTLKVLHKNQPIGECAMADFNSSWVKDGEDGWKRDTVLVFEDGKTKVFNGVWKDWTTVGFNLADYDGETLKIQLTTYDCSMTAHGGYAYFVLGCAKDKLDGENCDGRPSTDFYAPAGFKYRWYDAEFNPHEAGVLSTDQHFYIDSLDQHIYAVDVVSPQNDSCYFTLYASSQAQFPQPGITIKQTPRNCQNYITIENAAVVKKISLARDKETGLVKRDTAVYENSAILWDLDELTDTYDPKAEKIEVPIPNEGGQYLIHQTAYLNNCQLTLDTLITIDSIGPSAENYVFRFCPGDLAWVNGKSYAEPGDYVQMLTSKATGCDSTLYVHVEHIVPEHVGKDTIILDGDSVFFHDKWYKESVLLFDTARAVSGKLHCDSLIDSLNLYVHQNVMAYIQPYDTVCQDSSSLLIPYRIMRGRSACAYSLVWADDNILSADSLPLPENGLLPVTIAGELYPNIYEGYLTVYDSLRYLDTTKIVPYKDTIYLVVNYPSSILTQRWNDVLAVKNEANNGGYIFSDYQWYKNNMQMEGDTATYIYSESGLDMSAQYAVRLTRQSDGVVLFTCPASLTYIDPSRVENIPTLVDPNSQLPVQGKGIARWITPSGMPLSEQNYENGYLQTPSLGGLYLLQIMPEERRAETHHVIVK